MNNRLTLDYGVRLVHQQPQYDELGQASNFLPEEWSAGAAPVLYVAGCANGVYPCTGTNRQAMDPITGQFLGPNTILAIGTVVRGTGNRTNGLFLSGQGIVNTTYNWPTLAHLAAVRHGLRPDRPAAIHPARRRRALLRSSQTATPSSRRCRIRRPIPA